MAALTAFNRKKSGVNGVEPKKQRRYLRLTGKLAALRAKNWGNSGVDGIVPEKGRR